MQECVCRSVCVCEGGDRGEKEKSMGEQEGKEGENSSYTRVRLPTGTTFSSCLQLFQQGDCHIRRTPP